MNMISKSDAATRETADNPFIESFNGSFRDECLNVNWFLSLEDAKEEHTS